MRLPRFIRNDTFIFSIFNKSFTEKGIGNFFTEGGQSLSQLNIRTERKSPQKKGPVPFFLPFLRDDVCVFGQESRAVENFLESHPAFFDTLEYIGNSFLHYSHM